tara:strand:- start:1821 stop:2411 length:591 start_codon:yes stop_codon:yes gene_type:complete
MKRLFDIVISLLALLFFSPIFVVATILIKITLGSPIFYIQKRPGLNCKLFKLIKFRTMKKSELNYIDSENDLKRITKLGKFLRNTSIDELPELINVFFGSMSIVGPRPLLEEYLGFYSNEQMRRHTVKPGITGWAQINGRNKLSWDQRFILDNWYVDNHNLFIDIKIILTTVIHIIKRKNINESSQITKSKFKGNN